MQPRVHTGVRGEGADPAGPEAADAPQAVQPGHDRPPQVPLHRHRVPVHDHVGHPGRGAEQQHRGEQEGGRRGEGGERHGRAPRRDQQAGGPALADPVREPARGRHRAEGADGRAEQGEAENGGGQVEPVLDPRDAGRQGARDGAVQDEHDRDGAMLTRRPRGHGGETNR
ncbi:hypothetical protein LUX73_52405 [Actinomadura madurae]|nr:hypothetical protein [Actinomadura madurae]MCQ0012384.1 hypothetical protein [Actinomadura madurae]